MSKPLTYYAPLSPECEKELNSLTAQSQLDLARALIETAQETIQRDAGIVDFDDFDDFDDDLFDDCD